MDSHDAAPDYIPNPLHLALVAAGLVGEIPPLSLLPAWLALAAIAAWPWGMWRLPVAALAAAFTLADGVLLALLPRTGRSFGPVTPPLLGLTLTHTAVFFAAGLLRPTAPALLLSGGLNLALSATAWYATWIEPFRLIVERQELRSPKLAGGGTVRLLHISDLHVEHLSPRERELLRRVEELKPDLVVITGDYLTISSIEDSVSQGEVRELLARLSEAAAGPVYAITGSPPVDPPHVVPAIFAGLDIRWLLDETTDLELNGHSLRLIGLRCTADRERDGARLRRLLADRPSDRFTVLLYHSPDLMPEASALGIDLYLCGHTHGGQIRLPVFGALFTSSAFWKRYEMGRYEERGTTLYVSRGLGMEGAGAPRARFLAPPEIVLWTLGSPK